MTDGWALLCDEVHDDDGLDDMAVEREDVVENGIEELVDALGKGAGVGLGVGVGSGVEVALLGGVSFGVGDAGAGAGGERHSGT